MFEFNFPQWDRDLFLYLNDKHLPWLDPVMLFFSNQWIWTLVCLAVFLFIFFGRKGQGRRASFFFAGGVLTTLVVNNLLKLVFMRPRPGHEILLKDIMHQLEEMGRSFSFFSSHSASSMCVAMFSALYFKNIYYRVAIFLWATIVAYSRIYVGKHYPLDVFVGILFGLLMGYLAYWTYRKYYIKM
ncbi:undecaprenyl-diphosphatase [Parabacteroides sp. PFB2-12]|uniref:phosphatase PAP2 family protein n=1 Tax=unclassified Parabacteroides TaxID=2649774 RepID=UPI002474A787|nr:MULTISPECIES: phosphatase PAP2 family protein [unclassified Parabacteroides]MDH6342462.1 undecaprenyl-diphosphatase [Parabacteroides sp. PM6-13]MDH6390114.1 undecaprenyl-diphosphatase [Parabacteroides sp. PFB2-12]